MTAFANTREDYTRLFTLLTEATGQATPTGVTVGCEATGPYWLSLDEALTACRFDPMLRAMYDCQRQRGKHHLVALSHVANKLMRVIYAVLKGQRPYDPHYQVQTSHT